MIHKLLKTFMKWFKKGKLSKSQQMHLEIWEVTSTLSTKDKQHLVRFLKFPSPKQALAKYSALSIKTSKLSISVNFATLSSALNACFLTIMGMNLLN